MKYCIRLFSILLLVALASCSEKSLASDELIKVRFLKQDSSFSPEVRAEVVRTPSAIRRGLMYRDSLGEQEGMLFVFSKEGPRSFWMKNTYVELDIIFLSKDLRIVSIQENAKPLTTTRRPSEGPAKFVLEVRGGSAKSWGLDKGHRLVLPDGFLQ